MSSPAGDDVESGAQAGTARWEAMPEVLTVAEAAVLLRMKPATLYESIRLGLIPAVRSSPRTIRLSKSALRDWLQGKRPA